MASTSAPRLDSVARLSNGQIKFGWTNVVNAGNEFYNVIGIAYRKNGAGSWTQCASLGYPTISNQQYVLESKPGGVPFEVNMAWEFVMYANGPAGPSGYGNAKTLAAERTAAPTFNTATRISPTTVRLQFDPNPAGAALVAATYAYARVTGSGAAFVQVNSTTSGAQTTMDVSKLRGANLDGARGYEFELDSGGPGGYSVRTSRKTVGPWWVIPAGVTNLAGAWQGTTSIKLVWTGSPTAQGPYDRQDIYRAEGMSGLVRVATIAGILRTYTDSTAEPAKGYRYEVIPWSLAGPATQRPSVSVTAALNVPVAPSAVTAAYLAVDRAAIKWTRNPTTEKPYTSQRLLRRDVGVEAWTVAATLSGTATETTNTIGGNRRVEYAVEAVNAAGATASAPTTIVGTTPNRPPSLSAAWTGPTTINLSWPVDFRTIGPSYDLEFSTDNATWYPAPTNGPLPVGSRQWPHQDVVPTVPHWYRIRVAGSDGGPASPWVLSAVVTALTKPLAPTMAPPVVVDATEPVRLGFTHNPVDGTPQTGARVQFRKQGTTTWTVRQLTTTDFTTITAGTYINGDVLEVQAATAGSTGEYSSYSPTMLVTLRARPVVGAVTNSSPNSSRVTTTWTATGQASALVELLNSTGQVVEARTVGAAARTAVWTGLTDQATYTSRVTIADQWQKSLPKSSAAFTITLARPGKPSAVAEFRIADGTVLVTATLVTGTTRAEVFRDGALVGDVTSGMFIDTAPLGRNPVYTIRAYGPAGGFMDSDPATVSTAACDVYLTYGTTTCRAGWEPTFTGVAGRESVAHRYVGDDNGPSFTYGRKLARTLDCAITIDTGTGDTPLDAWIDASEHDRPVTYRDPSGRVMVGALTSFRFDDSDILEQHVSFTITQGRGQQ